MLFNLVKCIFVIIFIVAANMIVSSPKLISHSVGLLPSYLVSFLAPLVIVDYEYDLQVKVLAT